MTYRMQFAQSTHPGDYIRYDTDRDVAGGRRRLSMLHAKKRRLSQTLRAAAATFALLVVCGSISGVVGWYCYMFESPTHILTVHDVVVNVNERTLSFFDDSSDVLLLGHIARRLPSEEVEYICGGYFDSGGFCLRWGEQEQGPKLEVNYLGSQCYNVSWTTSGCQPEYFEDCFDMGDGHHWYGGSTLVSQPWPLEEGEVPMTPMQVGVSPLGNFQGDYWLSSSGISIQILRGDAPISVSINSPVAGSMCLRATRTTDHSRNLLLGYTICRSSNIRQRHEEHIKKEDSSTEEAADLTSLRHPTWSFGSRSSEAQTHYVSQVQDLLTMGNTTGAVLILPDDAWSWFDDPVSDQEQQWPHNLAKDSAISLAATISPFVELTPSVRGNATMLAMLLNDPLQLQAPSLVLWGDKIGGLLNLSNADTSKWLHGKMKHQFSADYIILQACPFPSAASLDQANVYYRTFALEVLRGNSQVITTFGDGFLGVASMMSSRKLSWDALGTLIPEALTMSLFGHGGLVPPNVRFEADDLCRNDSELYVRWIQTTALFPSFHAPIPPPCLENSVVNILRKTLLLRQELFTNFDLDANVINGGGALMWPLWWIAPDDPTSLVVADQFLVGEDLLMAPVVLAGVTSRDIYLPRGEWWDHLKRENVTGGRWLEGYGAELDELPHFSRKHTD